MKAREVGEVRQQERERESEGRGKGDYEGVGEGCGDDGSEAQGKGVSWTRGGSSFEGHLATFRGDATTWFFCCI